MSLDIMHVNEISRAIRGLCLGRVYLKDDCDVNDTEIKVGTDGTGLGGLDIPGSQLFRNNSLSARRVQPTATSVPGATGITHSEAVTLVEPTGGALHLTVSAGVDHAYTVARGAYIQLASPPAVCTTLQMIVKDFTEDMVAPEDRYLPGLFVTWMGSDYNATHVTAYGEMMTFLVRYAILEEDGVDNRAEIVNGTAQLVNLLAEDNYLGGTVHESSVGRVVPCWDPRSKGRGQVLNSMGRQVIWTDVVVSARRTVAWDKVSATA